MQSDSCYNSVIPRVDAVFLDHLSQDIRGTNSSAVWRYLIAYKNLLRSVLFCPNDASCQLTHPIPRSIENIGIAVVYGIRLIINVHGVVSSV